VDTTYFIKPGYISRQQPEYFADVLDQEQGVIHQPDIYPLAAYLARKFDCKYIVDIGCGQGRKLTELHPEFELIGIDFGENIQYCRESYSFGRWLEWDLDGEALLELEPEVLSRSVIVCADVIEHLIHPDRLLDLIKAWMAHAPVGLLTTPERDLLHGPKDMGPPSNTHHVREWNSIELQAFLRSKELKIEFFGLTMNNNWDYAKRTMLAILGNDQRPPIEPAPPEFRVVAIVTAYNEVDVLDRVLQHLNEQGIEVYVIDNWSTDGTFERVSARLGSGVVGVERFPPDGDSPKHQYNWQQLLHRVEEVSQTLDAHWYIHHDSDELRESPWPAASLRDAIYHVDQCGFNCINHTLLEFFPVDNSFQPGSNFAEHLVHYQFGQRIGHFIRINAWKNMGQRVSLAPSGGHRAEFDGQRVYPYKFLLKHYPLRSREQATRKIRARQKQSNLVERTLHGWHRMYDQYDADDSRLFDELCSRSRALDVFDTDAFYSAFLVERISGVGLTRLPPSNWKRLIPKWLVPWLRLARRLSRKARRKIGLLP
jgi:2-polyprenyl-3-methyl-5-hydroxy-6-metoxy-1,4-benzoquinol methylase